MKFSLRISHDRQAYRQQFEDERFVHIPDVLLDVDANRIFRCLLSDTPWNFVFTDRGRHIDMDAAQLQTMDKQHIQSLQRAIYAQAETGFQYCYNNYPIFDAVKAGLNDGHLLHGFYHWLNGETFLEFAREVTGFDDISFCDAQATRYKPGHFLTTHDDDPEGKFRRAAYIFNFTQDWPVDWGGVLQLVDEDENVRLGITPKFNALNILAVPQKHSVSLVAPFAGGMRLSIAGWLRYGEPD